MTTTMKMMKLVMMLMMMMLVMMMTMTIMMMLMNQNESWGEGITLEATKSGRLGVTGCNKTAIDNNNNNSSNTSSSTRNPMLECLAFLNFISERT